MRWLLHRLICNLLYIVMMALLSLLFSWLFGSIWGFAVMALLWIPSIAFVPFLWEKMTGQEIRLHWIIILLSMLTVFGCTSQFPGLVKIMHMKNIRTISASEISKYPNDFAFRFSDAYVGNKYSHLRIAKSYDSRKSTTTTNYYLVAPLVSKNWDSSQTVAAWAVCSPASGGKEWCDYWGIENGAGVGVDETSRDAYMKTVNEAASRFHLKNENNVRLLFWSGSIETEKSDRIKMIVGSVFWVYGAWAFLYCIAYLFRGKKMRAKEE